MDSMRQYDMEQGDLRVMASAVEIIQCWATSTNTSHFNTQQGVVVGMLASERVPSLVFDDSSTLSGSKGLECAETILRHIFGGSNGKHFNRDEFVKASRMCLSAPQTLELGKYVWPEEFVNNRPSPCPTPVERAE